MLQDLFAYLTTAPAPGFDATRAAALTTLQGLCGTRLYPDFLKERSAMPAMTYQLISNTQVYTLDGEPIDIQPPRVQIDAYSNTPAQREVIGAAIKTALNGYIGQMGGTEIGILMLDNEMNEFDSNNLQYRKILDFKVVHYTT